MGPAACVLAACMALNAPALAQSDPCSGKDSSHTARAGPYTVHFRVSPALAVARHFTLLFAVCDSRGATKPESVAIEATMPAHGHGMNYRPNVVALGNGRYRAEGLMFHMPGEWELTFIVQEGGKSERISHRLVLR